MVQYALLMHVVARAANMVPGDLVYTIGDAHIYSNHEDQVREQLSRQSVSSEPIARFTSNLDEPAALLDNVSFDDFVIEGYESHDAIKAPIAV